MNKYESIALSVAKIHLFFFRIPIIYKAELFVEIRKIQRNYHKVMYSQYIPLELFSQNRPQPMWANAVYCAEIILLSSLSNDAYVLMMRNPSDSERETFDTSIHAEDETSIYL